MYVSLGRRFVFVHIPKTGGTSLTLALESRATRDDIIIGDTPKARARKGRLADLPAKGRLWKHSTLADLDGWLGPQDLTQLFVLTLVRNPWDRMVSYYHWLLQQRFDHPAVHLARSCDFSAFLGHAQTRASLRAWPAAAYVRDTLGVERCTLFARLEHLDQDLAPFEAHLGFRLSPLDHANSSARARDWRPFYSQTDAQLIADLCAADIARFGYRFDPQ
jgi:hypothetical protein